MALCAIRAELSGLVVGVSSVFVIILVTSIAGIGGVVVVSVVALCAIGDGGVCAVQLEIVIVVGEEHWFPIGIGGMAGGAIGGKAQILVVGIGGAVEIGLMAGHTIGWSTLIAACVTVNAGGGGMCAGEREIGCVVVEDVVGIAGGVAGEAGGAFIDVSVDAVVFVVGLGVGVAGCRGTGDFGVIVHIGMTIHALVPFTVVSATVNGEVLPVVVEGDFGPIGRFVAGGAVGTELSGLVVGVGSILIIVLVAGEAIGGGVVVVAVVAGGTVVGDGGVATDEFVVVVVNGEGGGFPPRVGSVACLAIG